MTNKRNRLFEHQAAIISGGLGDIGRATALEFARQGASIALCDLGQPDTAIEFVERIKRFGVNCLYTQADVTDPVAIRNWIDQTCNTLGTPNIIIANAAMVTLAGLHEITPGQWSRELRVNLDGAFYLTQYASMKLVEQHLHGRIVFVGSWAASSVHPHIPAYSVSKAGVSMLCKCMALELAPHGILVNEIAPGYVNAGLSGRLWENNPEQLEKARLRVPVKRIMTANMVAQQVSYLCHPRNEHITGATLLMDGGLSLL